VKVEHHYGVAKIDPRRTLVTMTTQDDDVSSHGGGDIWLALGCVAFGAFAVINPKVLVFAAISFAVSFAVGMRR
jgi:hypothetical protein